VIEANSIGTRGGMIVLGAATGASKPSGAPTQTVKLAGQISAAGKDKGTKGGTVVVTGESIQLSGATIDASGDAGGGKVLIGGDTGGGKPSGAAAALELAKLESFVIPTATTVRVDAASFINISATGSGNGGKVVIWSDQQTTFVGTVLAQGGATGGNGGFVETSSHGNLGFSGIVDLSAPRGQHGTLLLDPLNATIDTNAGNQVITVASVQSALATGDVIVSTNVAGSAAGDITVAAPVSWTSANTLTLSANRSITINDGVVISNTGAGSLNLRADSFGSGVGTVTFMGTGKVDFSGGTGSVSIFYNPSDNPSGGVINPTSYTSPKDYTPYVLTNSAISNQFTAYMLVNSVYDLQNIQNNLSGDYALGKDIDATATASWNAGAGFVPIGNSVISFAGLLDGQIHTIDQMTINSSAIYVGLFGYIAGSGVVQNLGLTNVNVRGTAIMDRIGALVGWNDGTITSSYSSGFVSSASGGGFPGGWVGGLVGLNSGGTISRSYSTASVTGQPVYGVGGLVGANFLGSISESHATGDVSGSDFGKVGGLVGYNAGSLTQSFSTGTVKDFGTFADMGGLAGDNIGVITNSFATGAIMGRGAAGGLVGVNSPGNCLGCIGEINQSYATGSVVGDPTSGGDFGGLVGFNDGSISKSFATGMVSGGPLSGGIGGLVGSNGSGPLAGTVNNSYWDTYATGQQYAYGDHTSGGATAATSDPMQSGAANWACPGFVER
jgi:hypothetical protein